MAILPVLTAPDPMLKQKSIPVQEVDDSIRKLMDDMLETMYADNGVGLAAVQVGTLKRVITIDLQDDDDTERPKGFYPLFLANPEFLEKKGEMIAATEACLSLPEQRVEVARVNEVKITYLDYKNQRQELETSGWLARALQHEMDHLDGRLTIDYLTLIKKDIAIRKLTKLKKHYL